MGVGESDGGGERRGERERGREQFSLIQEVAVFTDLMSVTSGSY